MAAVVAFAVMAPAVVAFAVMVVVVVAACVGVVGEPSLRKGPCRRVSGALNAAIEPDPGFGQGHLRAHTDAATDQRINLCCLQETRKSSMTASIGIDDLLINNLPLFSIIQLKLLGMAKVLEDFSVSICDCNSHNICSFLNDFLIDLDWFKFTMSACDQQPLPVHKSVGNLFPCTVIDGSYRSPGNVHPGGTGFLGKAFIIQKS